MPAQRPWTAEEWKITVLAAYWQYFLTLTFAQLGTRWGRIHRVENWLRWVARQGNTHSGPTALRHQMGMWRDRGPATLPYVLGRHEGCEQSAVDVFHLDG